MASIVIKRPHRLSLAEARARAERVARRAESRHRARWRWDGDAIVLLAPPGLASGAHGRVMLDATHVEIEVHLPFALSPAKRFVESQILSRLDALLALARGALRPRGASAPAVVSICPFARGAVEGIMRFVDSAPHEERSHVASFEHARAGHCDKSAGPSVVARSFRPRSSAARRLRQE
jgi:putative polyhydroxyalkanoate system protein